MYSSRREFIALAAALGISEVIAPTLSAVAQTGTIRVRENVRSFALDQNKVNALRLAVKTMKARSASRPNDPTGWTYWASSHGTTGSVPQSLSAIYNQCMHSSDGSTAIHFLSWHRAFLFFFESVIKQAAHDAGSTTEFNLPYWDWYTQPVMPRMFTRTTDPFNQPNPLWHQRARTDLSEDALDRSAFGYNNMLPATGARREQTFSYVLEQDPHGSIHGLVGGDMGFVPRSARDPIFWLHHANIDRLWSAWLRAGSPVVPAANSTWSQRTFKYDAAGNWTKQAGPMLDTQASMQYRYDDEALPSVARVASAAVMAAAAPPAKVITAPAAEVDFNRPQGVLPNAPAAPVTLSGTTAPLRLGNSSVAVDMGLTKPSAAQLHGLIAEKPLELKSGTLVLQDVELGAAGKQGGFSFKIVASLPDDVAGAHRAVIGALNSFSMSALAQSQGDPNTSGKLTLTFPLADILSGLNVPNADALSKGLRVTFQPAHSDEQGAEPDFVKIGAIKIVGSTSAEK